MPFVSFNLNAVLKSLLLSTSEPISIKVIQDLITKHHNSVLSQKQGEQALEILPENVPSLLTASQIRNAIEAINKDLKEKNAVYRIVEKAEGLQLVVVPEYAYWVRLLREEPRPLRLGQSLLETLTIIAYKQPTTRPELEAIRGVTVDSAVQKLVDLELVQVVGRADLPGKPMQYGTTKKFLEFANLQSLDDLPKVD